ncbi:MAG: helix-turn-helix domain-containing protein [Bacteroidales bacterium]|nr:helix-turn-helix domain-containing protein [Bacteroidales bacterium]
MGEESERSYVLRADEISRLRVQRGLSLKALAAQVDVSARNMRRWMNGQPAYMFNVARLAEVLKTTPDKIIVSDALPDTPAPATLAPANGVLPYQTVDTPRLRVTVSTFELESFDAQAREAFVKQILEQCHLKGDVTVVSVAPTNSVLITLELSREDADRLVRAFLLDELSSLGITRLQDDATGEDITSAIIDGFHYASPNAPMLIIKAKYGTQAHQKTEQRKEETD